MCFKSSWRIKSKPDALENVLLKMRKQAFRPELPEAASAIFGGAKEHHSPSYPEKGVGNIIEA